MTTTIFRRLSFILFLISLNCFSQSRLPFKTEGSRIIDQRGERLLLKSVNWFGAESGELVVGGLDKQSLIKIVSLIKEAGFNSVRLPWCNEMLAKNPFIKKELLAANTKLQGKTALGIFDIVISTLTDNGLYVILDNHRSRGDWCCDEEHGDGLWYTADYPEQKWLEDWEFMAGRYQANKMVIAYELRNEIRTDPTLNLKPTWGDKNPVTDWHLAATKCGNLLLVINPNALIIVGGTDYQEHLKYVKDFPVVLTVPNRLVYAAHDYSWWHKPEDYKTPEALEKAVYNRWGYILEPGKPYTAPVYISEWGGCTQPNQKGEACAKENVDFVSAFAAYLHKHKIDWAYWLLNGTQSSGYKRTKNEVESYGLLNPDWSAYANETVMKSLHLRDK
jgi:endoglucanase